MNRRQRNSFFQCRQFRIEQSGAAMKVTTDACVLGAWTPLGAARRILDIGTGSGLLALFAAQRSAAPHTDTQIDAVEFDTAAAQQAYRNFTASPWVDRLHIHHTDIRQFQPDQPYDCILCNPPFFTDSTHNSCTRLAAARHDTSLPLPDLLHSIARLLADDGHAFVLLPSNTEARALQQAPEHGLRLSHRLAIRSSAADPAHRIILGLTPATQAAAGDQTALPPVTEEILTLYTEHPIHTAAAGRLFAPFYQRLRCEDPTLAYPPTEEAVR